ncbi:hypothetical protein A2U01_0045831 [Trifolium medium]|uniref:Uncharacterized protein n=1 Tax=Trifolium medium TaxID=97028 RepID=A0A392QM91_9FABA|nr:hypothetical protein [Trifolium medium]
MNPGTSRAGMHREQSSLYQGQAATIIYLKTDPARRDQKVKSDTPPTSPPPMPSTAAATPKPPHPNENISAT